jgi:DNA-directed RNA polymerase subunit RPC12/RpoP
MSLFDVYRCIRCGFYNKSIGEQWSHSPTTGIRACPECKTEGAYELIGGPLFDKKSGIISDENDDE